MLDQIRELSEILAAWAVIASLVFVAMQLRDNTDAVRASTAFASVANWADAATAVATNEELIAALAPDAYPLRTPQTKDQARVFWFLQVSLKTVEFNYLQWLQGNLSDDHWSGSRFGLVSHVASQQAYERAWPEIKAMFSSKFQTLINDEIIPQARAARAKFYRDNPDQVIPSEPAAATNVPG